MIVMLTGLFRDAGASVSSAGAHEGAGVAEPRNCSLTGRDRKKYNHQPANTESNAYKTAIPTRTAVIMLSICGAATPGGTADPAGVGNGMTSIISSPGTAMSSRSPLKTIMEILAHSRSCSRLIPVATPQLARPSIKKSIIRSEYLVNAGME